MSKSGLRERCIELQEKRELEWRETLVKPIVFLPLMTKPAREVEKGTKYLPEMWRPSEARDD